jgi:hypothetical protein
MIKKLITLVFLIGLTKAGAFAQQGELLIYHPIQTDQKGHIAPWFNADPAISYDHNIRLVWDFWFHMRRDMNGLPYYMNHQVYVENFDDARGIGGDQFAMTISSWRLLYAYLGDENLKSDMYFMAGYYLTHGLSPANCKWPDIPFPYNTMTYSGIYDGDMRNGKDITQPDKAGSFGLELITLYKLKDDQLFLDAAVKIANTLAAKVKPGDADHSPLPFKVNAFTGKTAMLKLDGKSGKSTDTACYTSNLTPTLELFYNLIRLNKGNVAAYKVSADKILTWLKKYPIKNNKWGPFFEDVGNWSQTQISAMTCARYMMEHPQYFPEWKTQVKSIINWVHTDLGNDKWKKYGVIVTNEQSFYPVPANSHSARQAADELMYVSLTGDNSFYDNSLLQLNWATYMVDFDGKNRFPTDDIWLTDGYGDYVRHYLRAMATYPALAPVEDHILSSTSVIQQADYKGHLKKFLYMDFANIDTNKVRVHYRTYDEQGTETIKLKEKPSAIFLNDVPLKQSTSGEGYAWTAVEKGGGVVTVRRVKGDRVTIVE